MITKYVLHWMTFSAYFSILMNLVNVTAFCAVMRSRVPILSDELSDIAAMRTELSQLRQITDQLSEQISGLKLSVPESSAMPACIHCSRSSVSSVQDSYTASMHNVSAAVPTDNVRNAVSL